MIDVECWAPKALPSHTVTIEQNLISYEDQMNLESSHRQTNNNKNIWQIRAHYLANEGSLTKQPN